MRGLFSWRSLRRSSEYLIVLGLSLATKTRRVLYGIGLALICISARLWHLTVLDHTAKLEEARRPQQRSVQEPAKRGTIRDRYNLPLAINQVHYQATIIYSQLQQIPTCTWERQPDGKRLKCFRRKEYIQKLAQLLAHELGLDAERIEDLIHSKAALYHQIPFVLKAELTEREYYRLKMLERQWLGLATRCQPHRCYPQGRVAADIIGYLGPIDRREYETILHEMRTLKEYLQQMETGEEPPLPDTLVSWDEAERRLEELSQRAYAMHDHVGKTGVEKRYERLLRGFHGQRAYCSDARGNFLRELPGGRPPLPGQRLLLTISAELQAYAEELLIANEAIRSARISIPGSLERSTVADKQPWIKGGALVALEPFSGEVLALASYPRFDPNDFIPPNVPNADPKRRRRIHRWLESESHLADIWERRMPLSREVYPTQKSTPHEEERWLSWQEYLQFILPTQGPLKDTFEGIQTLSDAYRLQNTATQLLNSHSTLSAYTLFNCLYPEACHGPSPTNEVQTAVQQACSDPTFSSAFEQLSHTLGHLTSNYDKVLILDLCRLAIDGQACSSDVLAYCGAYSLEDHHRFSGAAAALHDAVRQHCRRLFRQQDFAAWRQQHSREYLQNERIREKAAKRYPQPYIDLLDKQERILFEAFWDEHHPELLSALVLGAWGATDPEAPATPYLSELQSWHNALTGGDEQAIAMAQAHGWYDSFVELQTALTKLPAWIAGDYLKTLRPYTTLTRPLLGHYRHLRRGNDGIQREKHLAAAFYPLYGFGYGRSYAYRQATTQGSIFKLVTAYAALIQHQQRHGDDDLNPLTIYDRVERQGSHITVGYTQEGQPIPQHYKGGRLPKSLKRHIGKLDVTKALVNSSNPYFSLLAGDVLDSPEDLAATARLFSYGAPTGINLPAEISGQVPGDLTTNRTGLYATAIGQHTLVVTPLQASVMLAALANGGQVVQPKIALLAAGSDLHHNAATSIATFATTLARTIPLPAAIQHLLFEAMRQVACQTRESGWRSLKHLYRHFPSTHQAYLDLGESLVGKTSTAESTEALDLGFVPQLPIYNHLWFGGILCDPTAKPSQYVFHDSLGIPELVVVAYLRYGGYGKDAAPIAAHLAQRWRSIKATHQTPLSP